MEGRLTVSGCSLLVGTLRAPLRSPLSYPLRLCVPARGNAEPGGESPGFPCFSEISTYSVRLIYREPFIIVDAASTRLAGRLGRACETNPIYTLGAIGVRNAESGTDTCDDKQGAAVRNKANWARSLMSEVRSRWDQVCETKPICQEQVPGRRQVRASCETKPISGGGWLVNRCDSAKQSQLPGQAAGDRMVDCVKQSQSRFGRLMANGCRCSAVSAPKVQKPRPGRWERGFQCAWRDSNPQPSAP